MCPFNLFNLVDITKTVTIRQICLICGRDNPNAFTTSWKFPFLFNLVDNLSHAESAENTELPVLESLVHAGAGFHRLSTRFTVPAWRGSNA